MRTVLVCAGDKPRYIGGVKPWLKTPIDVAFAKVGTEDAQADSAELEVFEPDAIPRSRTLAGRGTELGGGSGSHRSAHRERGEAIREMLSEREIL